MAKVPADRFRTAMDFAKALTDNEGAALRRAHSLRNSAIPATTMADMRVAGVMVRAKDGQPCPTVRDFSLIDQDQSDNAVAQYLFDPNTGQTAQATAANQTAMAGASVCKSCGAIAARWTGSM
jgi:site-specific DNA-cytosine methylase